MPDGQRPAHILLIHQIFMSHADAGGTRHFEFARRLQSSGHRVTIIASDTAYLTGQRVTRGSALVSEEELDGMRVLRCRTSSALHKNFFWRTLSFLSFMCTSLAAAWRVKNVDLVWGTTPPIFQCISAWLVAVMRRRPFLLEVRDLFPEFAIDAGLLRNKILIGMARWLEGFLYARAQHIVVNSPAYREYLIQRGVEERKITLVANGSDVRMFDPSSRGEQVRSQFQIGDRFLVLYAGAVGKMNDLATMVSAAELLRHEADIVFMVVGDGMERGRIEAMALQKRLPDFILAGAQPKSRMPEILAAADCCIASLLNIPSMTMTYPNKVFDYMAAGRPTVLAIDGVIRQVMEAAGGGVCVAPGDPRAMADAIVFLKCHRELARDMGARARQHVEQSFNRDQQATDFVCLIERLAE